MQDETQNTNNGIKYKLQLLFANGECFFSLKSPTMRWSVSLNQGPDKYAV